MRKLSAVLLFQVFCAALFAQQPDTVSPDYKQMIENALKASRYGQGQSRIWDTRLKRVSGEVSVKTSGGAEWTKIEESIPLESKDLVKTGADGVAEIYLDDKGAISLGRNTQLEVSSLVQADSVFTLKLGSLAAKIQHFLNDKMKMQVRTPSAVCAVRGTEFAVEYSQLGRETGAAVYDEGVLAVNTIAENSPGQEYVLEKNMEIIFSASQKRFRPVKLSRMSRHRSMVAAMRQRLAGIDKTWRPMEPARRAELRDRVLKHRVIRRQTKKPKFKNGLKMRTGKALNRRRAAPAQLLE